MRLFDMPTEPGITEMSYPTRVVFGPGALARVPEKLERLGMKRPLVVTDLGVAKAGLSKRLYDVLAEPNTARAEMLLLRNTLHYANAALGPSDKLDVHKVNDRILRLWLHLQNRANDPDNPNMVIDARALDDFVAALYDPNGTVESFMRTLNTDPRFRPERSAPYIPWARDRAVVEADGSLQ